VTAPTPDDRPKRSDARRNERTLLDAAAAVFIRAGIEAPVRAIAEEAGVGMGTIYRHFPTRADLVVGVFRHQLDALAEPETSRASATTLRTWILRFADFLVTKHGLADAMAADRAGFERLHHEFVVRLEPVCAGLLQAEVDAGRMRADVRPLELMQAVGNLCIGAEQNERYDARLMIDVLLAGMAHDPASGPAPGPPER
jgi:AcrR family transcriptional regulator